MLLRFSKKLNLERIIFAVVVMVIVCSHWIWFFETSLLTSGDWGYIHQDQIQDWLPLPQLWTTENLGGVNLFFANSPVELALREITHLSSFGIATRLVYFIPTILISLASIIILSNYLRFSHYGMVAALLIYLCSTPLIITRTGHNTLAMAYAMAPLIIYFFYRSLSRSASVYTLITPIFGSLMAAYEPRAYYLLFFILTGQFLLSVAFGNKKMTSNVLKTLTFAFIVTSTLLLSSYWILPLIVSGKNAANGILGRPLFGSSFASMLNSLTLHHPFWNGGKYVSFQSNPIPFEFFILPFLLILSFITVKKTKIFILFQATLLIGLFLGKQDNSPLVNIYGWLYKNFPGFNAFREASKFYFYITLASAIIVGYLFTHLFAKIEHSQNRQKLFYSLIQWTLLVPLVVVFLFNLKPIATGEIGTLFTPKSLPHDYKLLNEYLSRQESGSRVLAIPTVSRWIVKSDRIPFVGLHNIFEDLGKFQDEENLSYTKKMQKYVRTEKFKDYLNENSIRFIVIPLQDVANDDDFFQYFDNDRQGFVKSLEKTEFKQVGLGMREVILYENANYKQRITVKNNVREQEAYFRYINAGNYQLFLKNVNGPTKITFREKYHVGWGIYNQKSKNLVQHLSDKALLAQHKPNKFSQNEYVLDVTELCKNIDDLCKSDKNGYSLTLNIMFGPQKYVAIGYLTSLTTLLALGLLLVLQIGYRALDKKRSL